MMKRFIKITSIVLAIIFCFGMLTACQNNEKDTQPTKPSTTEPKDEQTTPTEPDVQESEGINGTLTFHLPQGIYIITSTDSENFQGVYDEIISGNKTINNRASIKLIDEFLDAEENTIKVKLNDKFASKDIFSIGISEVQDWNSKIMLETKEGNLDVYSPMSNLYTFGLKNRYVKLNCAKAEFSYKFSQITEDGLMQSVEISGQLHEMADVEIRYNGEKYIITSSQNIYSLTVTSTGNDTSNPDNAAISANSIYYGTEFEITISQDGSPVIERTKF